MTKRYDVAAPREWNDRDGNKKTSWTNLGVAFEKDGKISILLSALPMPGPDGQAKFILMEPRERDGTGSGGQQQSRQQAPQQSAPAADLDDDIPW